jgi:hypothetical protein
MRSKAEFVLGTPLIILTLYGSLNKPAPPGPPYHHQLDKKENRDDKSYMIETILDSLWREFRDSTQQEREDILQCRSLETGSRL